MNRLVLLAVLAFLPGFSQANTDLGEDPAALERAKGDGLEIIAMVNFFSGSDQLSPRGTGILEKVVQRLVDAPNMKIELDGHTDGSGAEAFNTGLSERRARAAGKFLVDHGVDASRVSILGWGMYNPVDSNRTEAGRARNRRVEIKVSP